MLSAPDPGFFHSVFHRLVENPAGGRVDAREEAWINAKLYFNV
jgi:hypothetical protein